MKKISLLSVFCFVGFLCMLFFVRNDVSRDMNSLALGTFSSGGDGHGERESWNLKRLGNPVTGRLPLGIRAKEIGFLKDMAQHHKTNSVEDLEWIQRGPFNVGGRTRAFAIDVTDENIMLAIGVSGGIWRTDNGGDSWTKVSDPQGLQGATALAQDTRDGHTDTWYYTTGEIYGNSASLGGGFYLGDGVFKSTDGGFTWASLASTTSGTPETLESFFDASWGIATDPANDSMDVVYLATYGRLYRSTDGGESWITELTGNSSFSAYSNVEISPTGIVYATFGSDGSNRGIWRSDDGTSYTKILPPDFPTAYGRIVSTINPSNENEVYFLFTTEEGFGKETFNFLNEPEWNGLWKYTYVSGDGTGEGGEWVNLSDNLPIGPGRLDDFNAQGGYNLVLQIKPDDPNTILLGGTNIFRSTDGFTTPNNTHLVGGYDTTSFLPNIRVYENHHPDQHQIFFLPSDPNTVLSASDGGIARTDDIMADEVVWESLNNGYITTQFYTVAVPLYDTSNIVMGGLQDNGTFFAPSREAETEWVMSSGGDGSYLAIPDNADYYITSIQQGRVLKILTDEEGNQLDLKRIDPIGPDKDFDYQFINPLTLAPNNNNILYLPARNTLWYNDNLLDIPFDGGIDSISLYWDTVKVDFLAEDFFSSIAVCSEPTDRVFLGTEFQRLYRVDNARSDNPILTDITDPQFPEGYIYQIALDPNDNDRVFALFSNYEVYSLFYSEDAGDSWTKCAGNLEDNDNGSGSGPSLRWLSVLPINEDSTAYFLGTSIGLFHTSSIDSTNTVWTQVDPNGIGASIVDMVVTRPLDDLIVVATHGNGVYSANTPQDMPLMSSSPSLSSTKSNLTIYPNPVKEQATLRFDLPKTTTVSISIVNTLGQTQQTIFKGILNQGQQTHSINAQEFSTGTYQCVLEYNGFREVTSFVVL